MENLETLLTRLEVSPNGALVAGFRDLGEIQFPNWLHTFSAKLGRKWEQESFAKLIKLRRQLKGSQATKNPSTSDDNSRVIAKDWLVYQLDFPIGSKDSLPEVFSKGNYTKQARFVLKAPWHFVPLPTALKNGLQVRNEIQSDLDYFLSKLSEFYQGNNRSKVFNRLNSCFEKYDGSNFQEISVELQKLSIPEQLVVQRQKIQDKLLLNNQVLNGSARIKIIKGSASLEAADWNFLKTGRMISTQELFSNPILFLDIEIPGFRTEKPVISWVGSSFIENGIPEYIIDTVHDLQTESILGFNIKSHKDEDAEIDFIARRIRTRNPIAVSAHNARFDLTKLRESGAGFEVGEGETPPLYKVTTPFFERLGIKDRLVLDTMRWYKIAHAYDMNAKLEMLTGVEKTISYDEMERLEAGSLQDKRKIAEYLTHDISGPVEKVFLSDEFRKNLEDILFIAETFNVSPERLLHSPKCINEAQERVYFRELGIHREQVPPNQRTTQMQERRAKAREFFKKNVTEKALGVKQKQGLFQEAYKVYIPVGDILRDIVSHRFPEASKLYEYRDKHKLDKQRLFFIDQYTKSLSEWFVEYYGEFLTEATKLRDLSDRLDLNEKDLSRIYSSVKQRLNKTNRLKLSQGRINPSSLEKALDDETAEFIRNKGIDAKALTEVINVHSKKGRVERRLIGNFDVFPSKSSYVRSGNNSENPILITDILRKRFNEITEFIRKNNLEILCQEGNYLYLKGKKESLLSEDCPLVAVDQISDLYIADNPYYKKNGFYSHLRVSENPSFNLSIFEMNSIQEMLDNLLSGNPDRARQVYEKSLTELEYGLVPVEQMVFQNKSKGQYFFYSDKTESKKTHFIYPTQQVPQECFICEDSSGKYYKDYESNTLVRIMSHEQVSASINHQEYFNRFAERARQILKPHIRQGKKREYNWAQLTLL